MKRTPSRPSRRARRSRRARSGPSPTRTSSGAVPATGQRSSTRRQAVSRTSKPLRGMNRPTEMQRGRTSDRRAGAGRKTLRSTGGGSRKSFVRPAGESAGVIWSVTKSEMVERASTSSPMRRRSGRGPGSSRPPGLVAVGQGDDPLRARPPAGRAPATPGAPLHRRAPDPRPHARRSCDRLATGGRRGQQRSRSAVHLERQRRVEALGPRSRRGQDDHVVVEEPARRRHERLDPADPRREVVGHDECGHDAVRRRRSWRQTCDELLGAETELGVAAPPRHRRRHRRRR